MREGEKESEGESELTGADDRHLDIVRRHFSTETIEVAMLTTQFTRSKLLTRMEWKGKGNLQTHQSKLGRGIGRGDRSSDDAAERAHHHDLIHANKK